MKITNLTIKNNSISLENVSLDFSASGVHLIEGANGSGKTSLIKGILNSKKAKINFNDEYEEKLYKKEKYKLIANIEQDIKSSNISTFNYVTKYNKKIKPTELELYLSKFNLNKEILKQKFNKLSGGEQKKIQIISELLKGSKYIFLDEPTNNLDDEAEEQLTELLKELAKTKVLIITSHDERLKLETSSNVKIENNEVKQAMKTNLKTVTFKTTYEKKINIAKQFKDKFLNSNGISIVLNALFLMITLLTLTNIDFNIKMTSHVTEDNIHIAQINNYTYSQIVKDFEKYNKMTMEDDARKLLEFKEITNLAKNNAIEEMHIYEREKFDKIIMDEKPKSKAELKYIEVNEELNIEFRPMMDLQLFGLDLTTKDSRYPKNYKKEVATSKENLKNFFNFSDEDIKNSIGKKITLNPFGQDEDYIITGLIESDYLQISYEKTEKYSIYYKYNEETYNDFLDRNNKYIEECGLEDYYKEYPDEIIFKVKKEKEFTVTKQIYESSGLGHLFSYSTFYASNKEEQKEVFFDNISLKLIITSIVGICTAAASIVTLIGQRNLLNDIDNYYLSGNKQKRMSIYTTLLLITFTFLLIIPFNFINISYFDWFLLAETIGIAITIVITAISLITLEYIFKKKRK